MALTKSRNTVQRGSEPKQRVIASPVTATKIAYQGGIAVWDTGGNLKPGETATGLKAVGKFKETVDNSASLSPAPTAEAEPGTWYWANSADADEITAADRGKLCYIVDDQTVALTDGGTTRSICGTIIDVDDDGQVAVEIGPAPAVDGTSLTTEIAARQQITTDLASTVNAKGASLVGIEDAAGIYTGTTVEAALAERTDGEKVADLTDDGVRAGVPVVFIVAIADGVTADKDIVTTFKVEVVDVVIMKTVAAGGASDTITVKNTATAITDAISINIADKAIARVGTIDDASNVVAAGGTIRVTKTKVSAANVACKVAIHCVRRA